MSKDDVPDLHLLVMAPDVFPRGNINTVTISTTTQSFTEKRKESQILKLESSRNGLSYSMGAGGGNCGDTLIHFGELLRQHW